MTTSKPFARSYAIRFNRAGINIKRPRGVSQPYDPGQICKAYGWPSGVAVTPLTIVIAELGGKFYPNDVQPWAARAGLPAPTVTTKLLPGADDSPSDADGEVALDWQLAAQAWSFMTGLPASILLVNGPNSGQAFADCMNYAAMLPNIGAGSWSWGSPETQWAQSELNAMDQAAQASSFPWTAASGDNDSNDGTNAPVADAPAASPYIIGCGGTTFPLNGPETVWNNGNSEGTGGGFSKIYSRPSWQPVNSQGSGYMEPVLACNADPNTGYNTLINGQWEPIGGTSAVAPLMAGFFAVVNGARMNAGLPKIGVQMGAQLWNNPTSFFDVQMGNNGSYNATVGPDPCSGLGRPLGTLLAVLSGASQTPPPVKPPPIIPPPVPTGVSPTQLQQIIDGTILYLEGQAKFGFVVNIMEYARKMADSEIQALWTFLHGKGII